MVGELDAGNPHVQFDEGAQETCDSVTRLCPTLPQPLAIFSLLPVQPLHESSGSFARGTPFLASSLPMAVTTACVGD
jgi:hypothetical protein